MAGGIEQAEAERQRLLIAATSFVVQAGSRNAPDTPTPAAQTAQAATRHAASAACRASASGTPGAGTVVIKAAGAPVHYGGADGAGVVADLPRATPVDSTAAGDSFNAGYLSAWLSGAECAAAIAAGHALSRRVIRHRGALVAEAL